MGAGNPLLLTETVLVFRVSELGVNIFFLEAQGSGPLSLPAGRGEELRFPTSGVPVRAASGQLGIFVCRSWLPLPEGLPPPCHLKGSATGKRAPWSVSQGTASQRKPVRWTGHLATQAFAGSSWLALALLLPLVGPCSVVAPWLAAEEPRGVVCWQTGRAASSQAWLCAALWDCGLAGH